MAQLYSNNAHSTLDGAITSTATTITVDDGSVFDSPTGGDYFLAMLFQPTTGAWEVVKVTARSTNDLTVTRGEEGTAAAFADGAQIYNMLSAATIADFVEGTGDSVIVPTSKTPASASATGTQGQIAWDANYIYVCTATDTWVRAAIATW